MTPMTKATIARRYAATLTSTLGPAPVVDQPWFLDWSLYHFVGTPGGYKRPTRPKHLTTSENPGVFEEWARLEFWRERKRAHVTRPATGLWKGARLPAWAITVSKEMDKAGKPVVPPLPPTPHPTPSSPNPILVARAQRILYTAWRPLDARDRRPGISADLNCGGDPVRHVEMATAAANNARERGQEPIVWANQSQVGVQHLLDFAAKLRAVPQFQGETIGEMVDFGIRDDGSLIPGSPVATRELTLIGNPNAWTPGQRETATALYHEGRFALVFETYTNSGSPWPDASASAGVPASSVSPGVGWDRFPHQLPAYREHTSAGQWGGISPYLAEDFAASSWAVMPW